MLAKGELEGDIATFVTRGVPGMIGTDISTRVGMGDKFMPLALRDYEGPWYGTIKNALRHGKEGSKLTDQIRNISPGAGNSLRSLEGWMNGGAVTSAWKRDRTEYIATDKELAMKAAGARPIREARLQDLREVEKHDRDRSTGQVRRYVDRIVDAILAGDREEANRVFEEARDRKVVLPRGAIKRAMQAIGTPRAERELRMMPRHLRPEGSRRRQAIEARAE